MTIPYEGTMPYIFISYSHADKQSVMEYVSAIQNAGFNVWYDKGIRPGAEWEKEIITHLRNASGFVFFVSERSLASANCKDELYAAREIDLPIVNVLLQDIDLREEKHTWFAFRYSRYQMVPAYSLSLEEVVSSVCRGLENIGDTRDSLSEKERKQSVFQIENGLLKKYIGHESDVTVPNGVVAVADNAFKDNKTLVSVTLPQGVKEIGNGAFQNCTSLALVDIPNGVERIGMYAFQSCTNLDTVILPTTLEAIQRYTFDRCTNLRFVEIPAGVKTIGKFAFNCCTSLTCVTFCTGVTTIELGAFQNCTSLKSVDLPCSLVRLADTAFQNCTSMVEAVIPNSVVEMGKYTFSGCASLTKLTLPRRFDVFVNGNCQIIFL